MEFLSATHKHPSIPVIDASAEEHDDDEHDECEREHKPAPDVNAQGQLFSFLRDKITRGQGLKQRQKHQNCRSSDEKIEDRKVAKPGQHVRHRKLECDKGQHGRG